MSTLVLKFIIPVESERNLATHVVVICCCLKGASDNGVKSLQLLATVNGMSKTEASLRVLGSDSTSLRPLR